MKEPQTIKHYAIGFLLALIAANGQADESNASSMSVDDRLVEQLSYDEETLNRVRSEMGDRLTPGEIRALRQQLNLEEAARQNPIAPTVSNKVITINRGESPTLDIMQRFDTTLVFADRAGNPLNLTSWRISDQNSAELIPLYDTTALTQESNQPGSNADNEQTNEEELAIYQGPGQQSEGGASASEGEGPVNALIVSPRQALRSTNITLRIEGEDYPIVLTVRSHTSNDLERELSYVNEIRLDWKVDMPISQRASGKYRIGEALESNMLSLLQGVPSPELESIELYGELSSQVSLWKDATAKRNPHYFMRIADHLSPWNISIDDQSHDRMRGFTVIRLKGAPPKSIGFSSNGKYQTVTQAN